MKRDLDLIRDILIRIEEQSGETPSIDMAFENRSEKEVMYQAHLLYEDAFITGYENSPINASVEGYFITPTDLTMKGHDFLANARNETVWNKTKEAVKTYGGNVSLEIIKLLLIKFTSTHLGLPT